MLRIPRAKQPGVAGAARAVLVDPAGPTAAPFRRLAIRVRRELERREVRSLVVTSPLAGEGKTVVACNLAFALAFARPKRRVALVDLDLRRARMAAALGIEPALGMERILWGEFPLRSIGTPTDVDGLDLFPLEAPRKRVHELLSSPRLAGAIAELTARYDLVVIDAPPVLLVPDVPLVAPLVGAIVAVARAGATRLADFEEMLERLPREKLIGAFLNDARNGARRLR